MPIELILDSDVELISWVLAAPVVFHGLVDELLDIDYLVVGFLFVELIALPNVDLVLVVLMAWDSDLGPDAEDQERVFLEVLKVKDSGWIRPVWIRIELGLHLVLLVLDFVFAHLLLQYLLFHHLFKRFADLIHQR